MILEERILFTGGSGLLGSEIKKLIPRSCFPSHEEFDVTNYELMKNYLEGRNIKKIVHAAAVTSPPKVEKEILKALDTNIIGTSNIAKLCYNNGIKLIYISTDYVFNGKEGNYSEEDSVSPVNKYAWSKLGGECAVRMCDNSLIIRTSFGPNEFPYEKAFTNQWTSRESVSVIAKKLVNILDRDINGVIHLGGTRKTVYEYAREISPDKEIGKISTDEINFKIPKDTSLNCKKYDQLVGDKK